MDQFLTVFLIFLVGIVLSLLQLGIEILFVQRQVKKMLLQNSRVRADVMYNGYFNIRERPAPQEFKF